tara:strand:- start:153 stop:347 length:195 start_codon:yes stop_codon:yes gene_type:complete
MEELYREFEQLSMKEEPLTSAGIMMAQAMKIYKAMLSEDEFKIMAKHILDEENILPIDKPTLNG